MRELPCTFTSDDDPSIHMRCIKCDRELRDLPNCPHAMRAVDADLKAVGAERAERIARPGPDDRMSYEEFLNDVLEHVDDTMGDMHACEIAGIMVALLMRRISAMEPSVPLAKRRAFAQLTLELQQGVTELDRERGNAR